MKSWAEIQELRKKFLCSLIIEALKRNAKRIAFWSCLVCSICTIKVIGNRNEVIIYEKTTKPCWKEIFYIEGLMETGHW